MAVRYDTNSVPACVYITGIAGIIPQGSVIVVRQVVRQSKAISRQSGLRALL
jgi:hypothetical protein